MGLGSITRLINVRKVSRQCVSTHTPQNLNKLPKRISQWRVGQTFLFQCESLHLSKPASVTYGSRRLGFSDPCLERFNPRSSHQQASVLIKHLDGKCICRLVTVLPTQAHVTTRRRQGGRRRSHQNLAGGANTDGSGQLSNESKIHQTTNV